MRRAKPKVHGRAAPARSSKSKQLVKAWLIDTGCGHDLVSENDVKRIKEKWRSAASPITFATAGGKTTAEHVALSGVTNSTRICFRTC
jgi:hypothetical protein